MQVVSKETEWGRDVLEIKSPTRLTRLERVIRGNEFGGGVLETNAGAHLV